MKTARRARLSTGCFRTRNGAPGNLAHVRTVVEEWLDWEVIEPIVTAYQQLIDAEVQDDDKKLYAYQDFTNAVGSGEEAGFSGRGTPSLAGFVTQRRYYLLKHPELNKPVPKIIAVSKPLSEPYCQSTSGN